jgi:hypothetical protein
MTNAKTEQYEVVADKKSFDSFFTNTGKNEVFGIQFMVAFLDEYLGPYVPKGQTLSLKRITDKLSTDLEVCVHFMFNPKLARTLKPGEPYYRLSSKFLKAWGKRNLNRLLASKKELAKEKEDELL